MANNNIVDFPRKGTLPDLNGASWDDLDHMVIMASKKDGALYFASTTSDVAFMNYLADKFKQELLEDG